MARPSKKNTSVSLDATFYRELLRFYKNNKGAIRKHYHFLTRTILDYNDPDKRRPGQFLRRPQFEAFEIYVFLKEYCHLAPVHKLFEDWYGKKNGFENRGDVAGIGNQLQLSEEFYFNEEAYKAIFKKMQSAKQIYPNYIYALTMGVGKTLLMATCIFYEFLLAKSFPNDSSYCHNALIFAPDKTVLQSLREIESFDFANVLPREYANWLQANLSIQYLDETGATLNVLNGSRYNLIVSNSQKIILKRKNKVASAAEQLFLTSDKKQEDTQSVYDDIADLYGYDSPEDEQELTINQRFLKLRNLSQLGIFVDEAHHAFGDSLKKDLQDGRKETSLRFSINALAKGLESQNSRLVACHNFTGTPYVKNEVLPEVVYAFGLDAAIRERYLKSPILHGFTNTRSHDFVRLVVSNFLEKFKEKRFENMLPKLAFFAPDIADANENLRPALEAALAEHNISSNSILINVGDEKITSNDDIKAFNELDTPRSEKQFIILVNKGKEGWNCRSLCGVAMFRQPKSKVFVLQATMRCLRSIGKAQEEGHIYLSDENLQILNDELQQNFRLNTDDLKNLAKKKPEYEVRILKRKKISLTHVRHLYETKEKVLKGAVSFGLDTWDVEQYRVIHTEQKMEQGRHNSLEKKEDLTKQRTRRSWTAFTLVAEIARYLCISPLRIEKLLRESEEGMDALLAKVNEYNELLYDKVIPALFELLYEVSGYEKKESREIELVNPPETGFFRVHGDPEKTELFDSWFSDRGELAEKSFHLDTYCFDSMPEHEFFRNAIGQDRVKEIYFTGMLTHGQSDFYINYIDPETHCVRCYYPGFLILTQSNEWLVVEVKAAINMDDAVVLAKKEFAESMLRNSNISYRMIPHTKVYNARI